MRVLVTGGAGYVGSVAVEELVRAGEEVLVFDNLSFGHREAVHPVAEFVYGELADAQAIDGVVANYKPDVIMHFAARSLVGESVSKPFLYLRDNVNCGSNLFESAVAHGVDRIILSSTANLFGEPDRIPISEDEPIRPGSPYGESKYTLERSLQWLERMFGVRYACLRYFNASGASPERGEDHDPETHLIPLVLQVALGRRDHITIFGDDYATVDGTCVRDYIHVTDLARAHIAAMRALDHGSRTYNLGNGRGFSVREVIETAREVTGHPIPAIVGPRRAGDPAVLVASSDKIHREQGWQPEFADLRDIIETAWHWHSTHPHGYRE
ncbi:MAG: UDP-glucose 4-epimerase GalE [Proteobacteria bacterium]|nr:UDP-glucose 4-epimerase GalE [Pseudomonadota bacterium]